MKKKLICGTFIILIICSFHINSYSKYVLEDVNLEVANVQVDRTQPQITFLETKNIVEHSSSDGVKYDITLVIKITEKNLLQDTLNKEKIILTNDDKEIKPEIIFTETYHTQEEHTYEIQMKGVTKSNKLKAKFEPGLISDKAGWSNVTQELEIKI